MTRIATICARGGSKGLKNKNIKMLCGKPVIAYSIECARASGLFDAVVVSSDSADILRVAAAHGVDYAIKRPDEMASDTASKLPAIIHATQSVEQLSGLVFETIVELDPTSPLREVTDIEGAIALYEKKNTANVITAANARRSPYFNLVELDESGVAYLSKKLDSQLNRRQDSPPCFDMNASIYVWKKDVFFNDPKVFYKDTALYIMPEERSIDIDSQIDFEFVELLMKKKRVPQNGAI